MDRNLWTSRGDLNRFIGDAGISTSVKVFGRRLTSDGGRHVLGGRRLKTSKGRNRESEGPKGAIMGIWPTALAVAARAERRIDLDLSKPCDPSGVHDRFLNGGEHDGGAWEGSADGHRANAADTGERPVASTSGVAAR
jgi:hypothetical protein